MFPTKSAIAPISLFLLFWTIVLASPFDDSQFDDFPSSIRLEALQKRRGRELFGKRSGNGMDRQSRRTRELFGKRMDSNFDEMIDNQQSPILDDGTQSGTSSSPVAELVEFIRKRGEEDSAGIDRILSYLGHQRARRARGYQRELFGR